MEKYEFISKISEGAYGTVWQAKNKETGAMVAVKKMKEPPANKADLEFALREVRLLQQCANHPNVVQLLEAYQSQSGRLYLVFEYMPSTMLQLLRSYPEGLPLPLVKAIMWQLIQAVEFMHKNKIMHRDIKPSNVLIDLEGTVKICDFGFARAMAKSSASSSSDYTTYVVTRWYRSPEVLLGDSYGTAVDVWSLGCIFAELLSGKPLFPGKTHHDQLYLVLKLTGRLTEHQRKLLHKDKQFRCFKPPEAHELEKLETKLPGLTPTMLQLLKACLHHDPAKRLSAAQLLELPFFDDEQHAASAQQSQGAPGSRAGSRPGTGLEPDLVARLEKLRATHVSMEAAAGAAGGAGQAADSLKSRNQSEAGILKFPRALSKSGAAEAAGSTAGRAAAAALQSATKQDAQDLGQEDERQGEGEDEEEEDDEYGAAAAGLRTEASCGTMMLPAGAAGGGGGQQAAPPAPRGKRPEFGGRGTLVGGRSGKHLVTQNASGVSSSSATSAAPSEPNSTSNSTQRPRSDDHLMQSSTYRPLGTGILEASCNAEMKRQTWNEGLANSGFSSNTLSPTSRSISDMHLNQLDQLERELQASGRYTRPQPQHTASERGGIGHPKTSHSPHSRKAQSDAGGLLPAEPEAPSEPQQELEDRQQGAPAGLHPPARTQQRKSITFAQDGLPPPLSLEELERQAVAGDAPLPPSPQVHSQNQSRRKSGALMLADGSGVEHASSYSGAGEQVHGLLGSLRRAHVMSTSMAGPLLHSEQPAAPPEGLPPLPYHHQLRNSLSFPRRSVVMEQLLTCGGASTNTTSGGGSGGAPASVPPMTQHQHHISDDGLGGKAGQQGSWPQPPLQQPLSGTLTKRNAVDYPTTQPARPTHQPCPPTDSGAQPAPALGAPGARRRLTLESELPSMSSAVAARAIGGVAAINAIRQHRQSRVSAEEEDYMLPLARSSPDGLVVHSSSGAVAGASAHPRPSHRNRGPGLYDSQGEAQAQAAALAGATAAARRTSGAEQLSDEPLNLNMPSAAAIQQYYQMCQQSNSAKSLAASISASAAGGMWDDEACGTASTISLPGSGPPSGSLTTSGPPSSNNFYCGLPVVPAMRTSPGPGSNTSIAGGSSSSRTSSFTLGGRAAREAAIARSDARSGVASPANCPASPTVSSAAAVSARAPAGGAGGPAAVAAVSSITITSATVPLPGNADSKGGVGGYAAMFSSKVKQATAKAATALPRFYTNTVAVPPAAAPLVSTARRA